jgi:asparagine synthase (glutamine-hydrolysing)
MSAIAGIWHLDGSPGAGDACRKMLRTLEIYGADRSALTEDGSLSMGSHLLRVLPEDTWDHQPLSLRSGKGWLIADARIDNRELLARTLGITPEASRDLADSDFVLEAWERWGEDSVKHLVGAFSFAVWQPDRQRLFLARDPVGERPLYFCHTSKLFAFASMPKALLTLPGVDPSLDEELLARYLAIVPLPDGRTLFRDLQIVPHGYSVTITPDGIKQRQYWHPGNTPRLHLRNDVEYLDAFRDCFDEAVRCRLRTTGAIGAELSGGLDSSSVTATAALLLGKTGHGLTAFTHVPRVGFQPPEIENRFGDEGPFAAEVAALYPNIEHVLVPNGAIPMMDCVGQHIEIDDQPVFNPTNCVWLDSILDEARSRGISVVLTGRSGNGTISYDGFLSLSDFFRSGQWLKLARATLALRRNGFTSLRKVGGITVLPLLPVALQERLAPRVGDFNLNYCAVNPDLSRRTGLTEQARFLSNFSCQDVKAELNALFGVAEWGNENAGAMAGWRVELRDPTADQRVFEFIHSLPIDQFVRDGWMRSVVRRGMKGRLPNSTLNRFARGLQSSDWYRTMEESLPEIRAELQLQRRSPLACRVLDLPRLERLTETWPTEGFYTRDVLESYHYAFSRALGMGVFLRRHDPDFSPEGER